MVEDTDPGALCHAEGADSGQCIVVEPGRKRGIHPHTHAVHAACGDRPCEQHLGVLPALYASQAPCKIGDPDIERPSSAVPQDDSSFSSHGHSAPAMCAHGTVEQGFYTLERLLTDLMRGMRRCAVFRTPVDHGHQGFSRTGTWTMKSPSCCYGKGIHIAVLMGCGMKFIS